MMTTELSSGCQNWAGALVGVGLLVLVLEGVAVLDGVVEGVIEDVRVPEGDGVAVLEGDTDGVGVFVDDRDASSAKDDAGVIVGDVVADDDAVLVTDAVLVGVYVTIACGDQ